MAKRQSRHEWHQLNGKWTRSFGERGLRVTLFQKRKGGTFYRFVWRPGQGSDRKCLHTTDRREADWLARELLAKVVLLEDTTPTHSEPVTLGVLLDRYCAESATFLDNSEATRKSAATRVKILKVHFGTECDVRALTEDDVVAYTPWR